MSVLHKSSYLPETASHWLDNFAWNALAIRQRDFSQGDELARCYLDTIHPLAATAFQSQDAYDALEKLAGPDEEFHLLEETLPLIPADWLVTRRSQVTQMVFERSLPAIRQKTNRIEVLTAADIPDMLALTQLTKPGPFRQQTCELGTYLGLRESGRLVGMIGERIQVEGGSEIASVCTHPDSQGKGYAQLLVTTFVDHLIQRGETPFLHAQLENTPTIRLYEKLGFHHRCRLHLTFIVPRPTRPPEKAH